MTALLQTALNGLTVGSLYALIALGYSMVYGVLGMLNFAHGDVFMVGAYIGWGLAALLAAGAAAGGVGG
ncbi:MAG: ABC transporter permease subunit, partial [Bacillota bacterium]